MTESAPGGAAAMEAAASAMTPGARLAQARIARGLSVEGVAQQLKFAPRQIEALEGDRYGELPGIAVVRGMVRGYARLVQVDAAPLLEALKDTVPAPDANRIAARYREPVPFSDASKRSNVVYVVFTVAVLAVAVLVLVQWRQERPQPARMTFVAPAAEPDTRTTLASAGGTLPAPAGEEAAAEKSPVPPAAEAPSPAAEDGQAAAGDARAGDEKQAAASPALQDAGASQTSAAIAASAPSAEAQPAVVDPALHRVRLEFLEEAWVEVRDGNGKLLHAQLNSAGSEIQVEGRAPLSFVIGNAQFVRLSYDGRSVDLTPHIRVAVARFKLP